MIIRKNKVTPLVILSFSILLAFAFVPFSFSQEAAKTIIKGSVTDALTGESLPYVSVYLKGTTVGTLTDTKGKYSLFQTAGI